MLYEMQWFEPWFAFKSQCSALLPVFETKARMGYVHFDQQKSAYFRIIICFLKCNMEGPACDPVSLLLLRFFLETGSHMLFLGTQTGLSFLESSGSAAYSTCVS